MSKKTRTQSQCRFKLGKLFYLRKRLTNWRETLQHNQHIFSGKIAENILLCPLKCSFSRLTNHQIKSLNISMKIGWLWSVKVYWWGNIESKIKIESKLLDVGEDLKNSFNRVYIGDFRRLSMKWTFPLFVQLWRILFHFLLLLLLWW